MRHYNQYDALALALDMVFKDTKIDGAGVKVITSSKPQEVELATGPVQRVIDVAWSEEEVNQYYMRNQQ